MRYGGWGWHGDTSHSLVHDVLVRCHIRAVIPVSLTKYGCVSLELKAPDGTIHPTGHSSWALSSTTFLFKKLQPIHLWCHEDTALLNSEQWVIQPLSITADPAQGAVGLETIQANTGWGEAYTQSGFASSSQSEASEGNPHNLPTERPWSRWESSPGPGWLHTVQTR